MISKKLLIRC